MPAEESREVRLRRLYMRSIRRGIREMDLILGAFAERELARLGHDDLESYERLLNENDQDLYRWVSGAEPAPEALNGIIALVRKGEVGTGRLV